MGGGKPKYPWDEWFDGTPRTIEHDHPASLRTQALNAASRRGVKVRTRLVGDGAVYIKAGDVRSERELPVWPNAPAPEGFIARVLADLGHECWLHINRTPRSYLVVVEKFYRSWFPQYQWDLVDRFEPMATCAEGCANPYHQVFYLKDHTPEHKQAQRPWFIVPEPAAIQASRQAALGPRVRPVHKPEAIERIYRIREGLKSGHSQKQIAEREGVSQGYVSRVANQQWVPADEVPMSLEQQLEELSQ